MDDIETIDLNEVEDTGQPLMAMFESLVGIGDVKKDSTTLTNTKILKILKEEFDIDDSKLHKLEVDIYVNVVKRFLKEWPEWNEFDRTVAQLKKGKRYKIKSLLDTKYAQLKSYLNTMLELVKPMAEEAVQKYELENAPEVKETEENGPNDVVMEIRCTRAQLNKLVINHPGKDAVFNIEDDTPSKITVGSVSLEGLLNWHQVALVINLPKFNYRRHINHDMKHILINKKLKQPAEIVELNRFLHKKEVRSGKVAAVQVETLLKMVKKLSKGPGKKKSSALKDILILFYNVIQKDLGSKPSELQVPGTYKRYMNKYPYVRYLYTDIKAEEKSEEAQKYDLQLQETISPQYQFWVMKADTDMLDTLKMSADTLVEFSDRIFIKCEECNLEFHCNELYKFQCHMMEKHQNEPDLQCTNCNKAFTVNHLAEKYWHHLC